MGEVEREAVECFSRLPQEQQQALITILQRFSLLKELKLRCALLELQQQKE